MAPNHTAQLSFCLKLATFLNKLKLVQNTVRNHAVARNWPQVRLCNCRFASNWTVLLGRKSLYETACATVLFIEIGSFCYKAKTCPKNRAQLSCCSNLASKHSTQLSFCFKLARIVRKPKPVKKAAQNFRAQRSCCSKLAQNHAAELSFCFKLPVLLES